MARPLRFIPPDSVVEITCRTVQGRLLLKPSRELNDLLLGVLGRSQALYPEVRLHAFVFASNHVHLLLTVPDARSLASFMNHFSSNVAREAGRLYKWNEKFWGRRYRAIVVADEPSQVGRLRYILAHGAKERLVARPDEWPGASSLRALTTAAGISGTWVDRVREAYAHRAKLVADPRTYSSRYTVQLSPLPCWQALSPRERRRECRALVAEIERELAGERGKRARVLGPAGVLAQHPHRRPRMLKKRPAPLVHAATVAARDSFRSAYRAFVDAFRAAAEQLKTTGATAGFPAWSFPPRLPFRGLSAAAA
jgi:hypothetical protein